MTNAVYERAGKFISQEMKPALQTILQARRAAFVNPYCKGRGINQFDVTKLGTMSAATISFTVPAPDTNADDVEPTNVTYKIPVLSKQFKLDRMKADAFERNGVRFDVIDALAAARKVKEQEESLVFYGFAKDGTNYDISGFYTGAGNDYNTSSDFGTYGNAVAAVTGAKALADADAAPSESYNLFLNPAQYYELEKSFNATGGWEIEVVRKMLGPNGDIISAVGITDGTGLLCPVDPARQYIEFVNPISYEVVLGEDSRQPGWSPLYGTVLTLNLPVIHYSEALVKLSSI